MALSLVGCVWFLCFVGLADDRRPLLHALARELHALPAIRSTLARSFDPTGELLDTASPRLGGLRAAVRIAYDRLRRRR
jgi:dsDNA-specific endonuclease/ATPase MutS2